MQELIDIYDEYKNKTGKRIVRHDHLSQGEYTLGVQAIIINSKEKILISKRSSKKKYIL